MKKLFILIYLVFFNFNYSQNFQTGTVNEFVNFPQALINSNYIENAGGYVLPSTGNLKVLLIFAEFPDDNYDINNSRWIKGQQPQNMNGWVDAVWSANPTQGSLTHYFNEMSGNRLKITGSVVHTVAPQTRSWYAQNNKIRFDIQKEMLQNLDAVINYSDL